MVLKGVNWVHNNKIRSNGLERSQLGIQYKNRTMGPWLIWHQNQYRYTLYKSLPWNLLDFMVKSGRFHGKDLYNVYLYWFWWEKYSIQWYTMKSGRFHAWNPADFMKFGGFHEIWWISWQGLLQCISVLVQMKNTAFRGIPWNPADFMMKSGGFHGELWRISCQGHWFWWKIQHSVVDHTVYLYWFWRIKQKSSIHEIWQISWWNLADFMKSGEFHEIRQISSMKSGGFHGSSWKMQTFFITLITFFSM